MLHSLTLIPHPPVLIRELCGEVDAVPELRSAVTAALTAATAGADAVLAVGGGERTVPVDIDQWFDAGRFAPALRDLLPPLGPPTRPLALEVIARGLDEAGWGGVTSMASIGWQATPGEAAAMVAATEGPRRVALVVAADGSAKRDIKAPGHLDERAVAMDQVIDGALLANDAEPLLALTPEEAEELWIPGRAGLAVVALALAQQSWPAPVVHYLGDPFGVRYRVMSWAAPAR